MAVFSPPKPPPRAQPPATTRSGPPREAPADREKAPASPPQGSRASRRLPADIPHRYRPWPDRKGLRRLAVGGALGGLTVVIVAFAGAWRSGGLPFDGQGEVLHLHLALDQW